MSKLQREDNPWFLATEFGLEYMGLYYSKYRGFVINNKDEEGLNRLTVLVPQIDQTPLYDLAFPASSWGGKNYGVQMLPEIGDMVWVEFEFGNIENPIWSPSSYGEAEIPEEFKSPKVYGFKTPAGTLVLIDDTKEEEIIKIQLNSTTDWLNITKDTLEIESKKIKLGKDEKEAAVLGDTLNKRLDEIMEQLDKLTSILITHTHTSSSGPTNKPIQFAQIQGVKNSLSEIKSTIPEILSNKVTID